MISYSQNFEDVILNRIFGEQRSGFYVDVGAHYPIVDSVTEHFYRSGWRGINIEPLAKAFEMLQHIRPNDINLNVLVSEFSGETDFFNVDGLSTIDATVAARLRNKGLNSREERVLSRRLDDILAEHAPSEIDFLKVDVEGAEATVLKSNDWKQFRPKIVLVEAIDPVTQQPSAEKWEYLLLESNYRFVYDDGINRYYWRGEDELPHERLFLPVNVLDNFHSYPLIAAQQQCVDAIREREYYKTQYDQLFKTVQAVLEKLFPDERQDITETGFVEILNKRVEEHLSTMTEREKELTELRNSVARYENATQALGGSYDTVEHRLEEFSRRLNQSEARCKILQTLLAQAEARRAATLLEWERREFGSLPSENR